MFVIQLGKNKSAYKTKWTFNKEKQATLWYNGLNIGNGYKKRLLKDGKVIARYISR